MKGRRKIKNLIMIMGVFLFLSFFVFSLPANAQFFYYPYVPFYNPINFPFFQPLPLTAPPVFPTNLSRIANVPLSSGAITTVPALTPAGLSVTTLIPPAPPAPTITFTVPLSAITSLSTTLTVAPSTTSIIFSLLSSLLIY